jgi:hypothetical protein
VFGGVCKAIRATRQTARAQNRRMRDRPQRQNDADIIALRKFSTKKVVARLDF